MRFFAPKRTFKLVIIPNISQIHFTPDLSFKHEEFNIDVNQSRSESKQKSKSATKMPKRKLHKISLNNFDRLSQRLSFQDGGMDDNRADYISNKYIYMAYLHPDTVLFNRAVQQNLPTHKYSESLRY